MVDNAEVSAIRAGDPAVTRLAFGRGGLHLSARRALPGAIPT